MKTERRHTLQTNMLADYLGKKFQQIKPYTNWILGGALAVVVVFFVWTVAANYFKSGEDQAWQDVTQLISPKYQERRVREATKAIDDDFQKIANSLKTEKDPEKNKALEDRQKRLIEDYRKAAENEIQEMRKELETIATDFPNTPLAWTALMHMANDGLEQGSEQLPKDFENGLLRLEAAIKHFTAVKQQATGAKNTLLRQQAQLGLARAYEARNTTDLHFSEKDDLKLAEQEYEELVKQKAWCADFAQRRLAVLREKPENFHEWFGEAVSPKSRTKSPAKLTSKTEKTDRASGNGAAAPE